MARILNLGVQSQKHNQSNGPWQLKGFSLFFVNTQTHLNADFTLFSHFFFTFLKFVLKPSQYFSKYAKNFICNIESDSHTSLKDGCLLWLLHINDSISFSCIWIVNKLIINEYAKWILHSAINLLISLRLIFHLIFSCLSHHNPGKSTNFCEERIRNIPVQLSTGFGVMVCLIWHNHQLRTSEWWLSILCFCWPFIDKFCVCVWMNCVKQASLKSRVNYSACFFNLQVLFFWCF